MNEKIRAEKVQLITQDGENIGVVPRFQALRMAEEAELDLVVIAEDKDGVPIAKIMDFGKAIYKKKKKQVISGSILFINGAQFTKKKLLLCKW